MENNSAPQRTEVVPAVATATAVAVVTTAATKPKVCRTDEVANLLIKMCLGHNWGHLSHVHGQKKKVVGEIFKLMSQTDEYKAAGSPTKGTLFGWLMKTMDNQHALIKTKIKVRTGSTSEEGLTSSSSNPDDLDTDAEGVFSGTTIEPLSSLFFSLSQLSTAHHHSVFSMPGRPCVCAVQATKMRRSSTP